MFYVSPLPIVSVAIHNPIGWFSRCADENAQIEHAGPTIGLLSGRKGATSSIQAG